MPDDASQVLERLRELVAFLRRLPAGIEPNTAIAVANGLNRYFAGEPLDVALGVRPEPGQRDPRTILQIERRDSLLRSAASIFLAQHNQTMQAEILHRKLARYFSTGWRSDRTAEDCPRDGLDFMLWHIFKTRPNVPSERTIRAALGNELPLFVAQTMPDPGG